MQDSTQLLTTIAQLSGTFIAIICGFIFSKILNAENALFEASKKYRKENDHMIDEMDRLGITAYDIANMTRREEVNQLVSKVHDVVDEKMIITYDLASRAKGALLSLIPMALLGLVLPLVLLAIGNTRLSVQGQLTMIAFFIVGVGSIVAHIVWYCWYIYSRN